MGLQSTTNMRDACIDDRLMRFFVTILQGWAYKTQQTCEMHASNQTLLFVTSLQGWVYKNTTTTRDACEQSDAFFVTTLQGWVYKTQPTSEMHG